MSRAAIELQGIGKAWGEQAVLKQMDRSFADRTLCEVASSRAYRRV